MRWFGRRTEGRDRPSEASDPEEQGILDALRRLRSTTAREVMTPRVDVVALRVPVTVEQVVQTVKESGHSRLPVYEEDLDHLVGILFVKDLFRMGGNPGPDDIRRRLRQPFIVPESKLVPELLQEMRQRRSAFAVVVDEYGGVEGVLTVKDLVSELVGELRDEFDPVDEAELVRVDQERWLLSGQVAVETVTEQIGVPIPPGNYVTIGGFLFDRFGRIPEEGDVYHHLGWEFRVSEMERRRVAQVVVKAPEEPPVASANLDAHGK